MTTPILETKMASDDFAATFAAFREANDERLTEIEKKAAADPLLDAKVDRLNKRLETLSLSLSQPALSQPVDEAKSAWDRFIRTGDETALIEAKSLSSSDGSGGFITPIETENRIDSVLEAASPFRRIATVRKIGAGRFRKPVGTGDATSGWAGESDARPQTTAPSLTLMDFPVGELYAMPAATQALLDDSVADVDAWLAEEVRDVFAAQETAAFVNGNGQNKPKGLLSYQDGADALAVVKTGVNGSFAVGSQIDALMSLIYTPKSKFRPGASFMMNRRTLSEIRKLKDADGNYIWTPPSTIGEPSQLLGYAVTEAEDMPDIIDNGPAVAFGDFRRGYLIVDRQGIQVLRDPYSAKPYVLFYTTKRVGGGVQDKNAFALLEFAE
ncbi:phage major capsid protein [Algimonas porphyrae]|uniref:Phage capsid protein n=1 Tax=Algimonas porphyrae TaxID=1128113 RepID=A0ABQ5UWJ8_9PROT|nr:phage major capsid protein [Algimonas porphyrae]GLQ19665.1 phage capsid protein [Algimonas porphyrae]